MVVSARFWSVEPELNIFRFRIRRGENLIELQLLVIRPRSVAAEANMDMEGRPMRSSGGPRTIFRGAKGRPDQRGGVAVVGGAAQELSESEYQIPEGFGRWAAARRPSAGMGVLQGLGS